VQIPAPELGAKPPTLGTVGSSSSSFSLNSCARLSNS
ncbi:hypothetical protein A2U01_0056410, partial [Trifolium medium]|nr:hypothetical protein [Trifolium medium]